MTAMVFVGDAYGLPVPARLEALRAEGAKYLTDAFHASGTLRPGNRVARITELVEVVGGSTGRKALLAVEYADPAPHLRTELFVKFSRDLDDPVRDVGRTQMEQEVRLALLSREPEFPIVVPDTLFADYHATSGTGILISERIPFGRDGVEAQHHKCLDYEMPDQLGHYRALITALARLAGTQRSGRLPAGERFPVDLRAATVGERPTVTPDKLQRKLVRLAEWIGGHPGLFAPNVRSLAFLERLPVDGARIADAEPQVWRRLEDDHDYLALCHWNANVDNAWFWRTSGGVLQCGLMDWGCVSRMHVAMAVWGCLSGAETSLWDNHLDDLLTLFATEFRGAGGPDLDVDRLRRQLLRYVAVMGVAWLLDAPGLMRLRLGEDTGDVRRTDPRIAGDESLRAPLQMLTNVLNLWQRYGFGELITA